jgi:acyl transferase domain-containing protein
MNGMTWDKEKHVNDIAIIGMDGRFPGAESIEELWDKIKRGVNLISAGTDNSDGGSGVPSDNTFIKVNTSIDNIELFDAGFFGFTNREAEIMDPQHRIFMESAWRSLESAGYNPDSYKGNIALYAGCNISTYLINNLLPNQDLIDSINEIQIMVGNDKDHLATQTAYRLNLKGPCMAVQTSCSTSLVAVHLACESLLNGQCDMALAGGVTVKIPQAGGYKYHTGGLVSADGRCHTFDANASGTVYSNGVGIVVLKRFNDAISDRDNIYAVIKGCAVNSDGADRVGYTAPGVKGQFSVITEALEVAGVDISTIGYLEAHGTGTPLGDVIEMEALSNAFRAYTNKKGFCAIGSIKTNIGHTEMASGVTGLIKAALSVKYGIIPPSLNFEEPNPDINWTDSPFYVNTVVSEWKSGEVPRRAGVSSFGLGGTNAHVVIEETPIYMHSDKGPDCEVMVLSAKTLQALKTYCLSLADYLEENRDISIHDAVFTLKVGRKVFEHRCAVPFETRRGLIDSLKEIYDRPGMIVENILYKLPAVFVFEENLRFDLDLVIRLYNELEKFKMHMDKCIEALDVLGMNDLREIIFRPQAHNSKNVNNIAVFAIQYSFARMWIDLGIHPINMYGYGIGHLSAAAVSHDMDLKECFEAIACENVTDCNYWRDVVANKNAYGSKKAESNKDDLYLNISSIKVYKGKHSPENPGVGLNIPNNGGALSLILGKIGELWLAGCEIDWDKYYSGQKRVRVPLPTYPFERKRYWIEAQSIQNREDPVNNGKMQLSCLSREGLSSQFIPPSNDIEIEIAQIWEQQLGVSQIGIEDDFFELGGYSLLGASIINRINTAFTVALYLRDLFENPTISKLAECITEKLILNMDDEKFEDILKEI